MAKLHAIYRYPVKSFPGEQLQTVAMRAGEGLPDDRRYAITNGISNTMDGAWLTCRSFFINAVNDGLLKFEFAGIDDQVTLKSPQGTALSWRKGDDGSLDAANRSLAQFIAPLNPDANMAPPVITERTQMPGLLSGYWDFDDSAVSLMNVASLEAVAAAIGKPLDLRRLRGNLYLADLPAWDEFSLLGKRIRFGRKGPELEVLRPIKRCPATAVNPQTGERDIPVANALTDHFGHAYCGMYARVVKAGKITNDDALTIVGDARTPLAIAANPADTDPRQWPKPVELIEAQRYPSGQNDQQNRQLTIKSTSPWPLPDAGPGQRFRFHLGADLFTVATVVQQRDHTTVLHVEPSKTQDPATAHLMENVQSGDRLVVSGPFGKVA